MSIAMADDWGWSGLSRGVTIGSVTIRLAQDKARTRVRELSRLAVNSSRLDRLYQRIGNAGRIVSALFKADVDDVIRLQGNVASLEDLQLNTTVILVATVEGEVVGVSCAGAPIDLIAAPVEKAPRGVAPGWVLSQVAGIWDLSVDRGWGFRSDRRRDQSGAFVCEGTVFTADHLSNRNHSC